VNTNFFNKSIFKDIRFWILFFAIIRLYGITNPPLEIAHNWRQTTVTMAARNFSEVDANILYPRIDIAGDKTGITGMEAPIFNYLIYLFSLIFGYDHWYGRLINLVVSSIGVFYFYKLILKYFKQKTAFNAAFILIVSFWFAYSRKIMPDTFASSLAIISIYFGSNYLDRKANLKNLLLYFFFGLTGILSKLPIGYIWIIFAIWFFNGKIRINKKIAFTIATILMFIPVYLWYFVWVPHLVEEYGFWHFFMGKSLKTGLEETITYIGRTLNHFYETAIRYLAFAFLITGLIFVIIKKHKILAWVFILSLFAFSIIILKSGRTFAFHSYYVLPFIPVMALMAAYGLEQIKNKKLIIIILFLISVEGLLNQWNDFYIKPNEKMLINLENDFDKISNPDDLIVINSGYYPTPMYFTHRKGWVTSNENFSNPSFTNNLKQHGCKFILILKKSFGSNINLNKEIIFENDFYKIYKME
jgi:4-amino-4-deoxy-L-arabinose transferase-like glycosyltransferase